VVVARAERGSDGDHVARAAIRDGGAKHAELRLDFLERQLRVQAFGARSGEIQKSSLRALPEESEVES
jgi:hypothetical protein